MSLTGVVPNSDQKTVPFINQSQRLVVGLGQLVLSLAGFALVVVWFVQMMMRYYGQISGDSTVHNPVVLTNLALGAALFAVAWCWSLATSSA